MMTKGEFSWRIKVLPKEILSKTGSARYSEFNLLDGILGFKRVNTGKFWELDINVLYHIYRTNSYINTSTIKLATGGQVNSPSVAVLISIGCIDKIGNRMR